MAKFGFEQWESDKGELLIQGEAQEARGGLKITRLGYEDYEGRRESIYLGRSAVSELRRFFEEVYE